MSELNASESLAQKEVEAAKITYEQSLSNSYLSSTQARSSVSQSEGSFTQARINFEKLTIRSKISGVISQIPVKVGDEINIGRNLVSIENNEIYKIISYVSATQIQGLSVGDEIQIGAKSKDIIHSISQNIDTVTGKHRIEILHKNAFLSSGQIIPVQFTQKKEYQSQNFFLPLTSIHMKSAESFVWKVENNMLKKNIIQLGSIFGADIEIISGITENDKIVIEGGRMLKAEDQVTIR
ncbi:hypothetical protein COB57_04545 [Candidatus Peregrinibacteria bacterium]|nr:MAG: hypothetical protein COB57_04545 [Candidatus Peregrinibacteria bacterium]